jgi:hypothetical protein
MVVTEGLLPSELLVVAGRMGMTMEVLVLDLEMTRKKLAISGGDETVAVALYKGLAVSGQQGRRNDGVDDREGYAQQRLVGQAFFGGLYRRRYRSVKVPEREHTQPVGWPLTDVAPMWGG